MRIPNKSIVVLTALLTGLAAVAGTPGVARAAAAETVTVLPVVNPADVVSTGDRVFVSGGRGSTQIVVTDAAGTITGTLDGLSDPTDLLISNDGQTLYVAQPGAHSIAAYNTASLRQSAVYPTGADTCPSTLAYTESSVWFGYGCDSWSSDVGRIDLGYQPAVVSTDLTGQFFSGPPLVASALRNNEVLFVAEASVGPWSGSSYTIGADGALTQISSRSSVGGTLADAAIDATGTTVYTASGAPYRVETFSVADLTLAGRSYQTGEYPNAVEITNDGTLVAGGTHSPYAGGVSVFNLDGTVVTSSDLGGGQDHRLVDNGLAWHPDGHRLYAITNDGSLTPESPAELHVLTLAAA